MAEKHGIENLKVFVDQQLEIADIAGDAWEDEKINWQDAPQVVRLGVIAPKIAACLMYVPRESGDIDANEETELRQYIEEKVKALGVDTENDNFEKLVGRINANVLGYAKEVNETIGIVSDIKAASAPSA